MTTPKFSVGMATFDDYDRTMFTIQSLNMRDSRYVEEVIVVDNNPGSVLGKEMKNFCGSNPRVKYVAFPEPVGTSPPRNAVFANAKSDYVVCVDSHVIFHEVAFKALAEFYAERPDCKDLIQGPMIYDNLATVSTHFNKNWGGGMWGQWDTVPNWNEMKYFDIPSQGLGVFACRKDAWLGFNPRFRGFGGEEGYIHEKYRQAGRKALCLSDFVWWHSFQSADRIRTGLPYPNTHMHKVRNYVIGFTELGMEEQLKEVKEHFKIKDEDWAEWLAVGRGEVEYTKLHKQQLDAMQGGVVNLQKAVPCPTGNCGGGGVVNPVAPSVEQWFATSAAKKSDINEHVAKLAELSKDQDVVVEFGVRTGVSTAGLVYGKPKKLISVDFNDRSEVRSMEGKIKEWGVDFEFKIANSLEVDIPECDVLFIDTKHTGEQVYKELTRHGGKVRKRIAFHDTQIFGYKGEDGSAGLLPGITQFIRQNREWQTVYHVENNHGFTVISRDPADFPKVDGFGWRDGLKFAKAVVTHKLNGGKYLPLPVVEERLNTCLICPVRSGEQCSSCKCYLFQIPENMKVRAGEPGKVFYPQESCPLGKWLERPDEGVEMTADETKRMLVELTEGGAK